MTSHFVVFSVQNKAFIRMSLTSRAALCHVPVFLSALLRFIVVIHSHFSPICSDNALCRVLQIPFQFKRASSCFDSLKQTAESQRAHIVRMLLRCRRRITSVTDRNRQRRDRLFMHSNEKYQFHLFKQLLCGCVCGNLCEVF